MFSFFEGFLKTKNALTVSTDSSGENSTEAIFSIQFASDGGQSPQGNRGGTLNHPIGSMTGGMCCGFYQPTQDLANAFQTSADGLPLLDTWMNTDSELVRFSDLFL